MRFRWQPLAALALVPMGVALADYGDSISTQPAPAVQEKSAEHLSLIDSSERSLDQVTRAMHELAIAMQNARRSEDMMLATCLADILEQMRALQAGAIGALQRMHDTKTVEAARGVARSIAAKNDELVRLLDAASACEGSDGNKDGEGKVDVVTDIDPIVDQGSGGPSVPGITDPIDPPVISPPPDLMDPIDVMEPGTDVPTPPTASPMR